MTLKIAFIGCGGIAQQHMRHVKKYSDAVHIAVCDRDEVRLHDFAENSGITAMYTDSVQLLAEFKPDVVHILTPPAAHHDLALQCLESGAHVLIEKPLCVSVEEARSIAAAAKKYDRLAAVDYMRLFDPAIVKVKKLLASGKVGELLNITGVMGHDVLEKARQGLETRWVKSLKGGILFDIMPHLVYVVADLMPEVSFEHSDLILDDNDTVTELVSVFRGTKGFATLRMTLDVFPLQNEMCFECTRGVITVDLRNFAVSVRRLHGLPNAVERIVGNISVAGQLLGSTLMSIGKFIIGKLDPYAGMGEIIKCFYEAVEQKAASPVTVAQGEKVIELMEQIFSNVPEVQAPEAPAALKTADVLVTGGTGFIGSALVRRLAAGGKKVRVLTHREISIDEQHKLFGQEVELVQGDIYRYGDVEHACQGVHTVYHLAAAMKGDWNYHLDTTITGTKNMLNAGKANNIQHLVYVSTINVLDAKNYPEGGEVQEKFPYEDHPEKRGSYSHAKLKAENMVRAFMEDAAYPITIIRPGLVYGVGKEPFSRDVGIRLGKQCVIVIGAGNRKLPLVYLENLVDALIMADENKEKTAGEIFTIVDGNSPTQKEFINAYKECTGEQFLALYIPFAVFYAGFWCIEKSVALILRKQISLCYKLQCVRQSVQHASDHATEAFGWKPRVTFFDGLSEATNKNSC